MTSDLTIILLSNRGTNIFSHGWLPVVYLWYHKKTCSRCCVRSESKMIVLLFCSVPGYSGAYHNCYLVFQCTRVVVGFRRSRETMEFCAAEFFRLSQDHLVWLRGLMREWQSLWHFPQVKVVADLSAWNRVFLRGLFSSAFCARFSSKQERPSCISCFQVDLSTHRRESPWGCVRLPCGRHGPTISCVSVWGGSTWSGCLLFHALRCLSRCTKVTGWLNW